MNKYKAETRKGYQTVEGDNLELKDGNIVVYKEHKIVGIFPRDTVITRISQDKPTSKAPKKKTRA